MARFTGEATIVTGDAGYGLSLTRPVALGWDGTTLYMADEVTNSLYSLNRTTSVATLIAEIATSSLTFESPRGLAWDGTNLYVADWVSNQFGTLNRTTGRVTLISTLPFKPRGLAWDGTNLYAVGSDTDALYTIDRTTGDETRIGSATQFGVNETFPEGLAWDGQDLYMVGNNFNALFLLDRSTGVGTRVQNRGVNVRRFDVDENEPTGIAWDGTDMWLVGQAQRGLYRLTQRTSITTTVEPQGTQTGPFTVTFNFNEAVSGVTAADFSVNIGSIASINNVTSTQTTVTVNPPLSGQGTIVVTLAANSVTIVSDSSTGPPTAETSLGIAFNIPDYAVFTAPSVEQRNAFDILVTFAEATRDVANADFTVTGRPGATHTIDNTSSTVTTVTITPPASDRGTLALNLLPNTVVRVRDGQLQPAEQLNSGSVAFDTRRGPTISTISTRVVAEGSSGSVNIADFVTDTGSTQAPSELTYSFNGSVETFITLAGSVVSWTTTGSTTTGLRTINVRVTNNTGVSTDISFMLNVVEVRDEPLANIAQVSPGVGEVDRKIETVKWINFKQLTVTEGTSPVTYNISEYLSGDVASVELVVPYTTSIFSLSGNDENAVLTVTPQASVTGPTTNTLTVRARGQAARGLAPTADNLLILLTIPDKTMVYWNNIPRVTMNEGTEVSIPLAGYLGGVPDATFDSIQVVSTTPTVDYVTITDPTLTTAALDIKAPAVSTDVHVRALLRVNRAAATPTSQDVMVDITVLNNIPTAQMTRDYRFDMPDAPVTTGTFMVRLILSSELTSTETLVPSDFIVDSFSGITVTTVTVDDDDAKIYHITCSVPNNTRGVFSIDLKR